MPFDPDQFLAQKSGFDPDAFLGEGSQQPRTEEKSQSVGDWLANTFGPNGNLRGSSIGGFMQGMADPVVGAVQLAGNAIGFGDTVNRGISDKETEYQAARAAAGRGGVDLGRMTGNVSATLPLAGVGTAGAGATLVNRALQGAKVGGLMSAAMPVNNPDSYWGEKAKQVAIGAGSGAIAAPLVGALSRVISPRASVNSDIALLRREGVNPTIGQAAGGLVNVAEQKAQSIPILGDAIRAGRQRAISQMNDAAANRALNPIGESVKTVGNNIDAIGNRLGNEYDQILPNMGTNVTDPAFVNKIASIRQGVSYLPQDLQKYYDSLISREIDGRIAPNGVLSGKNLKDAWIVLRDQGSKFAKSNNPFEADLGKAIKQTFTELKTHVENTNAPALVSRLKNTDKGYANFKILQKALSSTGADEGIFSPAQLNSAVRALDRSKDKASFAAGNRPDATRRALMQDLSGASKRALSTKVPDSGTAERVMFGVGALASGAINPAIPTALIGGAAAYSPPVQKALVASILNRPGGANALAQYLRSISPMAALPAASFADNR